MIERKAMAGVIAAAMLVTAVPALAVAQEEVDVTLEGVVWTLTSVGDLEVPAEASADLYMEGGETNGSAGCNSFFGTYQLDGSSLSFDSDLATTRALCEGPVQVVEDAYLPALGSVASWAIEGNMLSLADASGAVVLTFEEATVDITQTDIDALLGELERLDDRISKSRQDVRSLNIPKIQNQTDKNTAGLADLTKTVQNQNVPGLRQRVIANEEVLNELARRFSNLRARVRDLEERVDAIEAQLPKPEPRK